MTNLELAKAEIERGRIGEALELLDRHLSTEKTSEVELLRAVCLARIGEGDEAKERFVELLKVDPDCYEAYISLAELANAKQSYEEAFRWASRSTSLDPLRHEGFGILGSTCLREGKVSQAVEALVRAVELAPELPRYRAALGAAYGSSHRHYLAAEQFEKLIKLSPQNPGAYASLASAYLRLGWAVKALDTLERATRIFPENAELHTLAASASTLLHNDSAAESHHRQAANLSREGEMAYATWLAEQGRFGEASERYLELIRSNPSMGAAYHGLFQCQAIKAAENLPLIERMEQLAARPEVHPTSRMYAQFALGKAYEQLQEYGRAMHHYDEANRLAYDHLVFTTPRYDPDRRQAEIQRALSCFESLESDGISGLDGPSPIFIIGLPRSGTTLLDQLLSNHSWVKSAGELRFWIEKGAALSNKDAPISDDDLLQTAIDYVEYIHHLVGDTQRTTDKMPGNFLYAGIISCALPRAKFIHLQRNGIDTGLSLYTTFLGTGGSMPYRKSDIVSYYEGYLRVMDYWRGKLPPATFMEVCYEELVSDPGATVSRILDFCELPWEEGCLHPEKNRAAIHTPSNWQARQPIYRSSVNRWQSFEPWLGELAALVPPRL
jgi:tetratricopeptide (TPR) repeat protein